MNDLWQIVRHKGGKPVRISGVYEDKAEAERTIQQLSWKDAVVVPAVRG